MVWCIHETAEARRIASVLKGTTQEFVEGTERPTMKGQGIFPVATILLVILYIGFERGLILCNSGLQVRDPNATVTKGLKFGLILSSPNAPAFLVLVPFCIVCGFVDYTSIITIPEFAP